MQIVINNERQPIKEGLYFTIDSVGTNYITRFRDGHWQSQTGHPVEKWIDPETPTFTIEDMIKSYFEEPYSESNIQLGWTFEDFIKNEYNIDIRLKENQP